ncbi:RNA-binding cell elongation regulator Jag/EloR [Marinisporobacter balticus]|uniref:RNA-binding protein KhpB n=1 Tax=Marinisporobacter balticus TaxID=2018667 RepID=A0A4R2LFL7_9FIRM|nr:RNA-binding cell elongation regulator Jag/EloR [Marinisporobacter balticus]TCO78055.1 spoIIIJ-associated protein [Marinisporobacter balticus]
MKFTEKTGKTVEEAVKNALEELGVAKDKVAIDVIEEPSRGFLGMFGTRLAKVKVTVVDSPESDAVNFLSSVLENMEIEAKYKTKLKGETLYIEVFGKDMGVLIGRRGQTLDSIQYLVSLVINKQRDKYIRVVLDTEDYRRKREQTLIRLANKLANQVKIKKQDIVLEPMNPYERRIIHSTLQSNPYIQTKSQGEEPFRKVVIAAK